MEFLLTGYGAKKDLTGKPSKNTYRGNLTFSEGSPEVIRDGVNTGGHSPYYDSLKFSGRSSKTHAENDDIQLIFYKLTDSQCVEFISGLMDYMFREFRGIPRGKNKVAREKWEAGRLEATDALLSMIYTRFDSKGPLSYGNEFKRYLIEKMIQDISHSNAVLSGEDSLLQMYDPDYCDKIVERNKRAMRHLTAAMNILNEELIPHVAVTH